MEREENRRSGAVIDNPGATAQAGGSPHPAAGDAQEDRISTNNSWPGPI
jgi:hypothetical protein